MEIDRRSFLAGAGFVFGCGLADAAAATLAASDSLFLATAMRADGSFVVAVFAANGTLIREIDLPGRGHDLAIHRASGRAVVFARRPGTFAVAFDLTGQSAPQVFVTPADRHFFGHGTFSLDGKLLFATENDFNAEMGAIGVYDGTDGYRRIGELPAYGIGTHEAILLADGRTLAVANGGIVTHPNFGRHMLNVPDMDPSLSLVDIRSGHLIGQFRLPRELHKLSIRHMAVDYKGIVWFGTQWVGDPLETPSLVGRFFPDTGFKLARLPSRNLVRMQQYVGALAASRDGTVICASAPRGGQLTYWSAEDGRFLGETSITDSSGISGYGCETFLASNGEGRIVEAGAGTASREKVKLPRYAFDNHLRVVS